MDTAPPLPVEPAVPVTTSKQRQRQVRLPSDQVKRLIADYRAGATVSAVARTYGVSLVTATKHLTDNEVPIRPNKVAISAADFPTLLELKAAGWNNVQLAEHYGCSRQAVQQALRRAVRLEAPASDINEDPR